MGILACLKDKVGTCSERLLGECKLLTQFLPRNEEALVYGHPIILDCKFEAVHNFDVSAVLCSQQRAEDCVRDDRLGVHTIGSV